LLSNYQHYK